MRVGIACDAGLIPDPDTIIEGFEREFDRLADDLLPAPDEGPPPASSPQG